MDTFKAGNPDSPVSGIAVIKMATLDVLQRAAAVGDSLTITHEPTFFKHLVAGLTRQAKALELPGVQALVIGEAQEWEAIEYVADAASEGKQKSLIVLGYIRSEPAWKIVRPG